jgi:hypothetical protein
VAGDAEKLPFRWDLVSPAQLGSLLAGTSEPDLWFLDELVGSAGKVVARGGGDLVFVGRSLDSMFDLLGGALAQTDAAGGLSRLPVSFNREPNYDNRGRSLGPRPLVPSERAAVRRLLATLAVTPERLARRSTPVAFVDVVAEGSTFGELFTLIREWIVEERAAWATIRRKIRFVGITVRGRTSPNWWRWQQHAEWTRQLPAGSVLNVSLDREVWSYLGNHQTKLHDTFVPEDWVGRAQPIDRDEPTRQALAEAVAIVAYGRSLAGRRALARAIDGEPALAQPWLRRLVAQLNRGG